MKRLVFFLLIIGIAVSVFGQVQLPEYRFASGSWGFVGPRLYQNDVRAPLAKANFRVPQSGPMLYEFNTRYESGAEDGHGGFGVHLFVDAAYNAASWGAGKSYLLWLNYDENPLRNSGVPSGLSAQVYKSLSNSSMTLVDSVNLNEFVYLLTDENLSQPVPVKLWMDGSTGEVRVYDPTDPELDYYFYFYLDPKDVPIRGDWVALRTNGLKLSFALGL
jgi:hypothetical protein